MARFQVQGPQTMIGSTLQFTFQSQVGQTQAEADLNSMDEHTDATLHDVYGAKYKIRVAADTTAENYAVVAGGYIATDSSNYGKEHTGYRINYKK